MTTSSGTPVGWLIVRAQAGDTDALEGVLREAARIASPVLRRVVGDQAGDILQEVLWIVSRKLQWLDRPEAFRAWIYRIAVRAALKHLKRERRLWPFTSDENIEDVAAPAQPTDPMRLEVIEELLRCLSPRSRIVIALHYLEEMSLEQVAMVLDVPVGTVKSRLAYGLAAMRREAKEKKV